jgi:hypothetical protein
MKNMEILGKILGSTGRVKIMRLFLLNPKKVLASLEVAKRARINSDSGRRELKLLNSIGFVKKHAKGFIFNPNFKYSREIEYLLIGADSLDREAVVENFKKVGKLKLLILSGVFIKNKDSRVDLLVVGDKIKRSKLEEEIAKLEAEVGTELTYALFDTKEFAYRINMYDKLVRDILDFSHEVVFQAKELSTQALKKA